MKMSLGYTREKTNAAPKDAESSESAKEVPGSGTCQTLCWDYGIL